MASEDGEHFFENPVQELNRETWRRATSRASVFRYIPMFRSKGWKAIDSALRDYEAHAWVPRALVGNPFLLTKTDQDGEREAREKVAEALRDYAESFATTGNSNAHVEAVVDLVVVVIRVTTWVEQLTPLAKNRGSQHRDVEAARYRMQQRYARSRIQPLEGLCSDRTGARTPGDSSMRREKLGTLEPQTREPRECPPIISAQPFPREHGDQ